MIRLTTRGWEGSSSGRWSRGRDIVTDRREGITLDSRTRARSVAGADEITGEVRSGIGIQITGSLLMGFGQDLLSGRSRQGDGISNEGFIEMGLSDDRIIGSGRTEGIRNDGGINAGDGTDEVDASRGGFGGSGSISLGSGNDTLRGFGRQRIFGDTGRDAALLLEGTYTIRQGSGDRFTVTKKNIDMNLFAFERIGSDLTGDTLGLRRGTLVIATNGDVSYI